MDRASARSARGVGVTAFGVNVIVLPPDTEGRRHHHERQEERCFLQAGRVEMVFGDGSDYELGPGGFAQVDPTTVRTVRSPSDSQEAVFQCAGGAGGYVGRNGWPPDGGRA